MNLKKVYFSFGGYRCNHNCPMCWRMKVDQKTISEILKHEITADEFKKIIKKLPNSVEFVEACSGGETLMFPSIDEQMYLIKKRGFFGQLITNGRYLEGNLAQELVKMNWDRVQVSFNSASKKTHRIVNGSNDYEQVLANIANFVSIKKPGMVIGLAFVYQKDNYRELVDFIKLSENLGVDFIKVNALINDSPKRLFLTKSQIKEVLKVTTKTSTLLENNFIELSQLIKNHPNFNLKPKNYAYFEQKHCGFIQDSVSVSPTGEVMPCCMSYGTEFKPLNLRNQNLDMNKIWNNPYYLNFRQDLMEGRFKSFCLKKCTFAMDESKKNDER